MAALGFSACGPAAGFSFCTSDSAIVRVTRDSYNTDQCGSKFMLSLIVAAE